MPIRPSIIFARCIRIRRLLYGAMRASQSSAPSQRRQRRRNNAFWHRVERLEPRLVLSIGLDSSFGSQGVLQIAEPQPYWTTPALSVAPSSGLIGAVAVKYPGYPSSNVANGEFLSNSFPAVSLGFAPSAEAADSSGRFIVAGTAAPASLAVSRVVQNFSSMALDATFGTNGTATITTPFSSVTSFVGVAALANGDTLIAGTGLYGSTFYAFVTRLDTHGAVDSTFGSNGIAYYAVPGANYLDLNSLIVSATGAIVAGGSSNNGIFLAEFSATGTLTSALPSLGGATWVLANLLAAPDGSYVVIEDYFDSVNTHSYHTSIFNYKAGLASSSFIADIAGDTPHGATETPGGGFAVLLQSTSNLAQLSVAHYLASGQVDASFATNGVFTLDHSILQPLLGGSSLNGFGIAAQPDGKLVVVATASVIESGNSEWYPFLVRLAEASSPTGGNGLVPIYRLYNTNAEVHTYTSSPGEYQTVKAQGLQDETIGVEGFYLSGDTTLSPVYRLYNPHNGQHYLTLSTVDRDFDVNAGWNYEGIEAYASTVATAAQPTEIHMLYNNINGEHLYTADAAYANEVVVQNNGAWVEQTPLGYGVYRAATDSSLLGLGGQSLTPLTITPNGYSVSTNDQINAIFTDENGVQQSIAAYATAPNRISVGIPLLVSSTTNDFRSGNVSLAIQTPDGVTHPVINQFQVTPLPPDPFTPGSLDVAFLTALQSNLASEVRSYQALSTASNNRVNVSQLVSATNSSLIAVGQDLAATSSVAAGSVGSIALGTLNGQAVSVGSASLAIADRLIVAALATIPKASSAASIASPLVNAVNPATDPVSSIGSSLMAGLQQDVRAAAATANQIGGVLAPVVAITGLVLGGEIAVPALVFGAMVKVIPTLVTSAVNIGADSAAAVARGNSPSNTQDYVTAVEDVAAPGYESLQSAATTSVTNWIDGEGSLAEPGSLAEMYHASESTYNAINALTPGTTASEIDSALQNNQLAPAEVTVTESGSFAPGQTETITMVDNAPPTDPVTIPLQLSDSTAGTLSTPDVTFTPQNWDVPQQVDVTGENNGQTNEVVTLNPGQAVSADPAYSGYEPQVISLRNSGGGDTLTGNWSGTVSGGGLSGPMQMALTVAPDGQSVSGTFNFAFFVNGSQSGSTTGTVTGTIVGSSVSLVATGTNASGTGTFPLTLTLNGSTLNGTMGGSSVGPVTVNLNRA